MRRIDAVPLDLFDRSTPLFQASPSSPCTLLALLDFSHASTFPSPPICHCAAPLPAALRLELIRRVGQWCCRRYGAWRKEREERVTTEGKDEVKHQHVESSSTESGLEQPAGERGGGGRRSRGRRGGEEEGEVKVPRRDLDLVHPRGLARSS